MIQDLEDSNKSISLSLETLLLISKLQVYFSSGNCNSLTSETVSINLAREIVSTEPQLWAL